MSFISQAPDGFLRIVVVLDSNLYDRIKRLRESGGAADKGGTTLAVLSAVFAETATAVLSDLVALVDLRADGAPRRIFDHPALARFAVLIECRRALEYVDDDAVDALVRAAGLPGLVELALPMVVDALRRPRRRLFNAAMATIAAPGALRRLTIGRSDRPDEASMSLSQSARLRAAVAKRSGLTVYVAARSQYETLALAESVGGSRIPLEILERVAEFVA